MRRFRILFLVIAVLVVVPVGLLLQRAVASVEMERRTGHQAVAERIFDEMERALSALLAGEEARPFGEYSHGYSPPGEEGGALVRSPLAETPRLPFIVGYFQIDPDGTLQTPLHASSEGGGESAPAMRVIMSELDRIVAPHFRGGASVGLARGRTAPAPQAPGTTVTAGKEVERDAAKEKPQPAGVVSAYDALRALNKGAEQRASRQAKTELEYAPVRQGPWQGAASAAAPKLQAEASPSAKRGDEPPPPAANEPTRLEIAPMVGRVIDPRHMLLYRTVVREAQTYRQGLLLDLDRLAAWLQAQALGNSDMAAYAIVAFADAGAPVPALPSGGAFVYQHRFAEPFADLSARLVLQSLPGIGSACYVYALCAVVAVVGSLGLVALYRMVAVTVTYAERRSNFVAAVSHELKTPLTAIRMYGEMLRDGIVPAEAKRAEYYRHITAESERLSRLINNVLEFSRLEKGTRQMLLVTESVGPVVLEGAELLRSHAENQGFTLDVEVDGSLPAVRFERDAMLQILFNLVDNAVKYARDGEPRRICLACHGAGREVCVSVRDHGPGVAPRQLRLVFEPFSRGENELARRSKGSGLGLALVRSLATQMGARAVARNLPTGGFAVEVVFPALRT